jgi:outer membrane protein
MKDHFWLLTTECRAVKSPLLGLLLLAGLASSALAQSASPPATLPASASPQAAAGPHQVGLIDMAYVFKNYEKFKAQTAALQQEIEQTDAQAKSLVQRLQQYQSQLTSGTLQPGSDEFTRIESEALQAQVELEAFKRTAQRDFLRKEAEIYKTIYLDVESSVSRYAQYYHYTLVLRFNRQTVDEATDPKEIANGMNRQVVHFRSQDDLTDPILDYLNSSYRKQTGAAPAARSDDPQASPSSLRR